MADESLKDIGINLSNDFQALVGNYTSGWLTDNLLSSEDWGPIALLFQETEGFEGVINELEVWEKVLTTGFIPLLLASTNKSNLGEETQSEYREKIHPYLETWKRYESLVNPGRQISTAKGQSSYTERRSPPDSDYPSLPIADTPSTPKVTSQRVVGPGQSPKNHPELGTISDNSDNVEKKSLTDTIITPNNLGWSKSDSDRVSEVSPVDEFSDIQTQYPQNINLPNLQDATEKTSRIQSDSARNSLGMKGLKDLSAFLASQSQGEHIIDADLLSNSNSETLPFSERESADIQLEQSRKTVTNFSNLSQQRAENAGLLASKQMSETLPLSERELADIQLEQSRKTVTNFSNLSQQRAENAGLIASKEMSESLEFSERESADFQGEESRNTVTDFSNLSQREENAGLIASKEMSESLEFSERESADFHGEVSRNTVTDFSNLSQQREKNARLLASKEMEVTNKTEIADDSRLKYARVEPILSSDRTTELEMEMILEAIAQEINREYRRFYGD